jgi:uncharacterized protein
MIKPASGLCNMACKYCFYRDVASHRQQYSYGMMTMEVLEQLVRRAMIYADGQASFSFQGGEPMLAGLDFYRQLMIFEKKYNTRNLMISNSIQTNGTLIDAKWAAFFAENHFLTGVSVDGDKAIHDSNRIFADGSGTYAKVMDGIGHLKKAGAEYNVLCVVTAAAAERGAEIYHALSEHQYLQFIPCIEGFDETHSIHAPGAEAYGRFLKDVFDCYERSWRQGKYVSVRTFDNYIGILRGQRPEHCGMSGHCGIYYLAEANGNIYPCDFYVLDQWKLGNIVTDSFVRLANMERKLGFVESSLPVPTQCAGCKWYGICRGGCRRDREPFMNGKPGLNRYCEGFKDFFEYAYQRLENLASKG